MHAGRDDVLRFRLRTQGIGGTTSLAEAAVLDLGVQDTGPDGARWALELRGCRPADDELSLAWTLRGAPHAYRRKEIADVAAATAPFSEADAAKRIFDASRPLKEAGIPVLDALAHIAALMADIVREPMVKGELSTALTGRLEEPYLRFCRACNAIHAYEQPFRLAALQAGLELQPGTSPPVLQPIPGWTGPASSVPPHLDPIRATLHLLGPATPKLVAGYLDAPVREVASRWPQDVVPVEVDGEERSLLAADADLLADPPVAQDVHLLGPFDLFLQARDRELVVGDPASRKDLWRTLGRPGGLLVGHEVVGSWRPRSSGRRLRLSVTTWDGGPMPAGLDVAAERLASHRGQAFAGYVEG